MTEDRVPTPADRDEFGQAVDQLAVAVVKALADDIKLIIGFFAGVLFTCVTWGLTEVLR